MTDEAITLANSLNDVNPSVAVQAETYTQQLLGEQFPDRDFGIGRALYWQCVVPNAAAQALHIANSTLMSNSMTLRGIRDAADGTYSEEAVLRALSNYYQTPNVGTVSRGTIKVVVTRFIPYSIPSGFVFIGNGQNYVTESSYLVFTTTDEVETDTDRVLVARDDGNWEFTIPVVSEQVGTVTFAPLGTQFIPQTTIVGFSGAVASTDISGGSNTQTVKELISDVPTAFAARTWGSANNVTALITENFPGTQVSITGMGDAEQTRDTHNPTGISSGGMADVWVNTQESIQTEEIELTGEIIDVAEKLWRIQIPQAQVGGIYGVLEVRPQNAPSSAPLSITNTERGFQVPTDGYDPYITTPIEAAFSVYQTFSIIVRDTVTPNIGLSVGDTQTYSVIAQSMPLVANIHDFFTGSQAIDPASKILIRGAVPCVTAINLVVRLLDDQFESAIDVTSMKDAIIRRVHAIGFGYGVLSSSAVVDAVHNFITGRSDVDATKVTLRGDITAPTGENLTLTGSDEIVIPNLPEKHVTKRTAVFLTDVDRVDIQFTRVETD